MHMTPWRITAAMALALALLAPCWAGPPGETAGDRDLAAWVDHRVQDWQPTPEERRFDDVGWAKDIRDAERLAKVHGRPVFLFTYDGQCLATYRC
jgi:hypothetical protein